jgi:hypothetical protein
MQKAIIILFLFSFSKSFSQKKILHTIPVSEPINLDGNLDEPIWKNAEIAKDFIMFEPDNGKPISNDKKTEVKIIYNNEYVYIGAMLYDNEPNKILKEITQRDDFGTTDTFGVFINGFNDGQQDFRFFCTASGTQADCLATETTGEDFSWDAVWGSKTRITDFGWVVEMRIPYAAIRFSDEKIQSWGINFVRAIKRDNQVYTWTNIDNKIGNVIQQAGNLEGIQNIKTPTRLFLMPYSSFYLDGGTQKTKGTIKGGLDIKYGINDAFTLDAILVPDFGQAKFDEKILNLGPFEQQFNENRAFFTEGTDLFNKGNLLYSRRIGGSPSSYPTLNSDEIVEEYPNNVKLINALKISGRTKNGLGIGVLNAVTEDTFVTVRNTVTQATKRVEIEPLTNYNVLVFDQRFNKNSSVSLINTNVTRNGSFRDANVSAIVFDLNTKKNTFNLSGDFKYSYINDGEIKKGIFSSLNLGKTSGKIRYGIGGDVNTKNFDNNDLGINFQTNYYSLFGNANYRILTSTKHLNSFFTNINVFSQFQKETGKLQANQINLNINLTNKKNHYLGFGINANPFENYDYYEPRTENRFVIFPTKFGGWIYFSSNYNYKFALDINPTAAVLNEIGRNSYGINIGPRYRFNDKFSLNYNFNFFRQNNNKGYINVSDLDLDNNPNTANEIIFANRNVITYSNSIAGKYSINSLMTINLSVRQYWSYSENKNFLALNDNGKYSDYSGSTAITNKDSNYNSWNFDLSYSWWFAPGSQLSVLYRNNSNTFEQSINKDFGKNISNLLNNDALGHVFSLSLRYFIDYNRFKH